MPRTIPCLDLHFPDLAAHPELPDMVSLALDDLAPAAIHEAGDELATVWRVFLADPARLDDGHADSGRTIRAHRTASRARGSRRRGLGRAIAGAPDTCVRRPDHRGATLGCSPASDGVVVIVYPSTGFGTGHHQTTRLCLRLLQQVELAGRRLVDLGTGSGVLALAAWRLGASDIEALDYDEDAIVNARENLRLNGAESAITLRQADLTVEPILPGDVVTANLTGAMLVAQAPSIGALVRPGGTLIVSGFLAHEVDAIGSTFAPELAYVEEAAEDTWRALRFMRL